VRPVKTKFLLADDDADDWDLFCEALATIDPVIKCITVENGHQLFDLLLTGTERPDVIFLDINMPVMNGWDCLKKLKDNPGLKTIPTIIYSTSSARQDVEKAYSLGALAFLSKPENFQELAEILKTVAITPHESLVPQLRAFGSVK
jgi:CheY-like chemotaxis protein